MIILMTGITGFLGSHLARVLVREGHEVHGLKRRASDCSRLRDCAARIHWHDLDGEALADLFTRLPHVDAIVHLATSYGRDGESDADIALTNTVFPLQLLQLAAARHVATFVSADTCINTWPIRYPYLRSYMLSKRHFAEWGEVYANEDKLRFINVKLHHPYGPGDGPSKFVPQLIRACLEETDDLPLTPGEQKKDFVYVDDVSAAFATLLRRAQDLPQKHTVLECGSGRAVALRAFVETVHRLTQSRARLCFGALPYREHEIMFLQADTSTLRELGWSPRVSLEQGIREILRQDYGGT